MGRPYALRHIYALARSAINDGHFPPGSGIPFSEEEAVAFFGGSRTETREALNRLTEEGILNRAPRRGTRTNFKPVGWSLAGGLIHPHGHGIAIEKLGEAHRIEASPALQASFQQELPELNTKDEIFYIDRTRVCLRTSYWVGDCSPRPVIFPGSDVSLRESFEESYHVKYQGMRSSITGVSADRRQAKVLEVEPGDPLLWRQTILLEEGGNIREISHSFYVSVRVFFALQDRAAAGSVRQFGAIY